MLINFVFKDWELHKPAIMTKNRWIDAKSEVMIRQATKWRVVCFVVLFDVLCLNFVIWQHTPSIWKDVFVRSSCIIESFVCMSLDMNLTRTCVCVCVCVFCCYRVAMFVACISLACTLDVVIFSMSIVVFSNLRTFTVVNIIVWVWFAMRVFVFENVWE